MEYATMFIVDSDIDFLHPVYGRDPTLIKLRMLGKMPLPFERELNYCAPLKRRKNF